MNRFAIRVAIASRTAARMDGEPEPIADESGGRVMVDGSTERKEAASSWFGLWNEERKGQAWWVGQRKGRIAEGVSADWGKG